MTPRPRSIRPPSGGYGVGRESGHAFASEFVEVDTAVPTAGPADGHDATTQTGDGNIVVEGGRPYVVHDHVAPLLLADSKFGVDESRIVGY